MGNSMVNGLLGMRMDRRSQKEITRLAKKMENGLGGISVDRSGQKKLTRMGN